MHIVIDIEGATPIFAQLIEQVKRAVLSGRLKPGDPLPSIRQLAAAFLVDQGPEHRAGIEARPAQPRHPRLVIDQRLVRTISNQRSFHESNAGNAGLRRTRSFLLLRTGAP